MNNTVMPEGYDIVEASQNVTIRDYQPGEIFYIYGSPLRPMSATWARIPGAVFVNSKDGRVHTHIVVPGKLDASVIASYELIFMYGPIVYKPE